MIKQFLYRKTFISIIVIAYNMREELLNTLKTLNETYQLNIHSDDYEVILIDNGSDKKHRFNDEDFKLYKNVTHYFIKNAKSSPAEAINYGVSLSKGNIVGILIDGARMLTPGVLSNVQDLFIQKKDILVTVPSWHIGPNLQHLSVLEGYNKEVEQKLIRDYGCLTNGYNLFKISVLAGSSENGCFIPFAESNAIFMHKSYFKKLGGYDTNFDMPGGGYINLDFYSRAVEQFNNNVIVLFGEGNFHQLHGGIATNSTLDTKRSNGLKWRKQYADIRGKEYEIPKQNMFFYGKLNIETKDYLHNSINKYMDFCYG